MGQWMVGRWEDLGKTSVCTRSAPKPPMPHTRQGLKTRIQPTLTFVCLGLLVAELHDLVVALAQRLHAQAVPGVLVVQLLRYNWRYSVRAGVGGGFINAPAGCSSTQRLCQTPLPRWY